MMERGPRATMVAKRSALFRLAAGVALTVAVLGGFWLWRVVQEAAVDTPQGLASAAAKPGIEAAPPAADAGDEHPLERLARRSPAEAWRAATELEQSPSRKHLLKTIATLWVEKDPQGALDAFEAMDEAQMPTSWMFEMLGRWMALDERAPTQWALATAGSRPRLLIGGAIEWLLENGEPRATALARAQEVLRRSARRAPTDAWAIASAQGLASETELPRAVAEVWFEDDPQAALHAAVSLGGWKNRLEPWIADLAAEWARAEPRTAADWALGLPALPEDGALLAAVHAALSVTSADEAFEFAGKFGDEKTRSAYYHPMYERQLRALLGNDLLALAEWLVRQPDAKLRGSKVRPIAQRYGLFLPDDAVQWALQLPDDLSKDGLGAVVQGIAGRDPSRAEDIVLGMAGQGSQAHAALGFLMQWAWERDQPAAAYRWSVENLPSSARLEANQGVLAKWAFTDPVAVASALADIADPDERFAAQKGAMLGLVGTDMDATPELVRARMLAVEEVFDSLRVAAAARGVWDDGRGNEFGGPVRRLLYGYWKEADPARAAKYKESPERYDERR